MKDWYARTIAPSLRGSPALGTELQILRLRDAEIRYDEEDVLLAMREPCNGELEGKSVQGYPTDAQFRPFFIGDADVPMRERGLIDAACFVQNLLPPPPRRGARSFASPLCQSRCRPLLTV